MERAVRAQSIGGSEVRHIILRNKVACQSHVNNIDAVTIDASLHSSVFNTHFTNAEVLSRQWLPELGSSVPPRMWLLVSPSATRTRSWSLTCTKNSFLCPTFVSQLPPMEKPYGIKAFRARQVHRWQTYRLQVLPCNHLRRIGLENQRPHTGMSQAASVFCGPVGSYFHQDGAGCRAQSTARSGGSRR